MTSNLCKQFVNGSVALVVFAIASAPASAQSQLNASETASEINAANQLLRDGKVDEALAAFRRIVPGDQKRDELSYNTAVAEYRKGNIEAAEKRFREVAGTSAPAISSNSRYNLGNCQYAKALHVAEQDRPAAIEHLRDAVSHYRGALRGNSNNVDARANIELASELIRKLELEQKQQDEQKKQDQEQQQQDHKQQQDDKKNEDQHQDKPQDSESQQSDSRKDESQEADSQKESEQQKSDSPDSKSDEPKNGDSKNQDESSASGPAKNDDLKKDDRKNDKSGVEQQKADDQQQASEEGKPDERESQNKPVPAGDLKAAGQQDEETNPPGSVAMADQNAKDGLMTREEALKMLQSVRDRDMLRRMQRQRQERSRHVPVDRDW